LLTKEDEKPIMVSESLTSIEKRYKELLIDNKDLAPIYQMCKEMTPDDNEKIAKCLYKQADPKTIKDALKKYSENSNDAYEENGPLSIWNSIYR
jgi:hypothetical protein